MGLPQGDFITLRFCIECLCNKARRIPVSGIDIKLKEKRDHCFDATCLQ